MNYEFTRRQTGAPKSPRHTLSEIADRLGTPVEKLRIMARIQGSPKPSNARSSSHQQGYYLLSEWRQFLALQAQAKAAKSLAASNVQADEKSQVVAIAQTLCA